MAAALPALAAVLALAACAPPAPVGQVPTVPSAGTGPGAEAGAWKVAAGQSLVTILVRRGGPFARFGHDHVVAVRELSGTVDPARGEAILRIPLDRLTVDEEALRAEAGLDTRPSAEDIAGTRRNMLVRVLEADRYPEAVIRVVAGTGGPDDAAGTRLMQVTVELHGVARTMAVPVRTDRGPDRLQARGELALRQTDFGMTPMTVLGGALRVEDEVRLKFNILSLRSAVVSGSEPVARESD